MKNARGVKGIMIAMLLLGTAFSSLAGLVFSVDFGSDSVDDSTAGNVSVGTATDITFANTGLPLANSNGRAAVFNGSTSKIDYGLGAGNELDIDGGGYSTPIKFTYHIRVKFNTVTAANQFLMGRQNGVDDQEISAIEVPTNSVRGFISTSGANDYGHVAENTLIAGRWYDIFFRFQGQYQAVGDGYLQTSVYNAETSALVAHSAVWGTGARGPFDGTAPFLVGLRGDGANALDGMVDQVNVWIGTPLTEAEMLAMSSPPAVRATTVTFDSDGGILIDGEPFFPRSLYGVTYPSYMQQIMPDISAAGINCWLSPWADNARLGDLMDLAHTNGMMVVPYVSDAAFLRGDYESDPAAKNQALATMIERVALFKDHPALLGWDIGNESMDQGAQAYLVKELTDAIHQEDPNHPVFFLPTFKLPAIGYSSSTSIWQSVSNACDAFLMDIYPVWGDSGGVPDTDQSATDAAMDVMDYSPGGNRLWAITQAFNWDDFGKNGRYPTAHELRFLSFIPIIRGANGVTWYFMADRYANTPDPFPDNPGFWDQIMAQAAEVTSVSDAIVSSKITSGITVTESSQGLRWAVRDLVDGYMVFVANFETNTVALGTITMDFLPTGMEIEKKIGTEIDLGLSGDTVSVTNMAPYDVAVFKLKSDPVVISLTPVSDNVLEVVFDALYPEPTYLQKTTNLLDGTWGSVGHSTNSVGPFIETNMSYSAASGEYRVIYLEATEPAAFFHFEVK